MSRDELVSSTYEAALELNRVKQRHGLLSQKVAEGLEKRIEQEWKILDRLDEILLTPDNPARDETIRKVMQEFEHIGLATLCKKDEMNWPTRLIRFNPLRVMQGVLTRD